MKRKGSIVLTSVLGALCISGVSILLSEFSTVLEMVIRFYGTYSLALLLSILATGIFLGMTFANRKKKSGPKQDNIDS